jgi:hypothetical protein
MKPQVGDVWVPLRGLLIALNMRRALDLAPPPVDDKPTNDQILDALNRWVVGGNGPPTIADAFRAGALWQALRGK